MWHEFWEPIVVAVVTGCIGIGFYGAKRIFSTFVALALARENAQDERLSDLEAWRLRTLEAAAKEINGVSDSETDAPSGRHPRRIRNRNPE